MSVDFADYIQCLDLEGEHRQALESSWHEAARVMSPRGLQNYLEGMRALCSLGRGQDLLLTYVQEMPGVVKEVGEDVIPDIVEALMRLASHTSGAVLTLVVGSLPLAAQRLGDAEVLRSYLKLLHQIAGKAPRGLRPMMTVLDELLGKLTLGGLRRWVMWGLQAHARDLDGQMAYFALQTESARSVLQNERRGTLFIDNQRRLNFYLRALWARSFFMRPTAGDYESRQGLKPFIEDFQIHLPDAFDPFHGIDGLALFRASAAHCAAHMVYTREPISAEQLSQAQMRFIELFEDARIEYLAYSEFPGLRELWLSFFEAQAQAGEPAHEMMDYMLRTTRGILDPHYRDAEPLIDQIAADFRARLESDPHEPGLAWSAGVDFGQRITALAPLPSLRVLSEWPIPYRDDNRYLWAFAENLFDSQGVDYLPSSRRQLRKYVSAIEMANEVDCELAGDDAQEIWVCASEFFPYEDAGEATQSFNDWWGREPVSDPYHYREWDYQAQLYRPDWATVIERKQGRGDPALMDGILDKYKPVASRIRHLIDALQPQGIVRRRGYEEGEELDLNAAVRAMIDIRRGIMPDPRINIRITRHIRDLAIVVLMDLSESTNDKVGVKEGEEGYEAADSVLDLSREACGLLAWAIDQIGDSFAVHGFASDGRHDVQYYRFKDFDQGYDDEARSRLAGMRGNLSTRMGAALRHAGWHLTQVPASKRLVLLVTDGEPADIDERDPQYLRHDAKKAVDELRAMDIHSHCLTLDPDADRYVARIFGENHYSIVDDVQRLPERLPNVFAALTR